MNRYSYVLNNPLKYTDPGWIRQEIIKTFPNIGKWRYIKAS